MQPADKSPFVKPESHHLYVVYDSSDGAIKHAHHMIVLPGGRKHETSEAEKRALDVAAKAGINTTGLRTVRLSPDDFKRGALYRIDVTTLRPVEVKPQRPDAKT